LVTATGITTAIQSDAMLDLGGGFNLGPLVEYVFKFSSVVGMWLGFAFLYMFMPNTRTRLSSALLGGIVGGTLWHVAQILHVRFQIGMANYNAIYSGFAAFPTFLIWIYVSWVTVLFGAELAFAHQNEPAYRQIARSRDHDHAFMEVLAVRVMVRVAAAFIRGAEPYDLEDLSAELGVPERSIKDVLSRLEAQRVVAPVDDGFDVGALPARDLDKISIKVILDALKGSSGQVNFPPTASVDGHIDEVLFDFERATEDAPENKNVRELAERYLAGIESTQLADGRSPGGLAS
jgi:membrane protein